MARAVVELRGCTRDFGAVRAVDALDLAVHEGELLSLLGPSGCGKTTTLNLIAGFVAPSAGRVIVDGQDVTARPPHERGLGVVFQSYALFPHMSVFENVAFGLRERRVAKSEIGRRVERGAGPRPPAGQGERRPRQLSGGMQQRAALARALVYAPRVLLLDEPLAALDRKLREEMRAELREILREVGITTVFVTHDQSEALSLSDRIAVMNQGRIEQLGPPRDVYERPATRFVADFIGGSSRLRGRAKRAGSRRPRVRGERGGAARASAPGRRGRRARHPARARGRDTAGAARRPPAPIAWQAGSRGSPTSAPRRKWGSRSRRPVPARAGRGTVPGAARGGRRGGARSVPRRVSAAVTVVIPGSTA
jgi:ABC-type Fe3+/spermidine/putrescine transport system ATPase subunit